MPRADNVILESRWGFADISGRAIVVSQEKPVHRRDGRETLGRSPVAYVPTLYRAYDFSVPLPPLGGRCAIPLHSPQRLIGLCRQDVQPIRQDHAFIDKVIAA